MSSAPQYQMHVQSPSPTPSPRLPWELTDAIIDFLYADTNYDADSIHAFSACSTVCSQFLLRSRFHAFATVQLWPWRARGFFELVASPQCTFARVVRRVEVDDRARRLGGRMATRGSSSSRFRNLDSRSGSGKRGDTPSVERSGSRTRVAREDGLQGEETEYMRFVDIMAMTQHHLSLLRINPSSLSVSNVDWTSLPATQAAQLRAQMAAAFPALCVLELHGATFHDMRELGRVVCQFEQLRKVNVNGTVFLKYPEHVMTGAEGVVLGRLGELTTMDLGRASGTGDGLEVPAVLTSVVDGLVGLTVRGVHKTHAAHIQRVFCEKGKALETVHLSLRDDPDAILSTLDLSPLSSLRTLAIHGLQPTSLTSSALAGLLKRVEASFFDTIELGLRLDGSAALPQLDCSALQKVLLEHQFFGLGTLRIVVAGGAVNVEEGAEGWLKVALPQLQGVMEVRVSTK